MAVDFRIFVAQAALIGSPRLAGRVEWTLLPVIQGPRTRFCALFLILILGLVLVFSG
jgi:hypothetical protein